MTTTELRLCVNCRHHELSGVVDVCLRGRHRAMGYALLCGYERSAEGPCGLSGRLFQPKDPAPPSAENRERALLNAVADLAEKSCPWAEGMDGIAALKSFADTLRATDPDMLLWRGN